MRENFEEDQYFVNTLCDFKRQAALNSIFTISKLWPLILILFERLPGAHTSRTGNAPITYPFSLDELDTEFDQGGNGFSAFPATGQNAKNVALRKYNGVGAAIIFLSSAAIAITLVESIPYWCLRLRRSDTYLWRHRGISIKLRVLTRVLMTAIQMGLCVTLLVAIHTLRAALQADPVIAKYLEDMRAQLRLADGGGLDPISREFEMLDFYAAFTVAISLLHGIPRVWIVLVERVFPNRRRLPDVMSGHALKAINTISDHQCMVGGSGDEDDDTGALARAYKMEQEWRLARQRDF